MQLKDKVAYITGSASGIGKEIAILFAQEGAKIIIADLNKEAADATAAELKATGAQAIGVAVDVTNEDQKQIPEQAKTLGISEEEVIKNVMLKETVDGEFTTTEDVARVALLFAGFPTNALTGQSLVVSHG
eukprot:gene6937-9356_t